MYTPNFTLIIGNKNYSSWSLRPWILMKYFKIPFEELLVPLYEGNYKSELVKYAPNEKVPILIDGDVKVWESLSICEYVAERFPNERMWPQKIEHRAWARSVAQEMHAGFSHLRKHMPMNIRGTFPGKGRSHEVGLDIHRVLQIWESCRRQFKNDGPFLFGHFTIADAMFVPVVTRFRTYGVKTVSYSNEYYDTILDLPSFKEWEAAAGREAWVIKSSEIYSTV